MNPQKQLELRLRHGWFLTLAAGLLSAATLSAQSGGGFELKNGSFTTGGGDATNGPYRLNGAFKPSAPGVAINGNYALTGEFTGAGLVQTPGAPPLKITRTLAGFVLIWPDPSAGFTLQSTPTLAVPNWSDVAQPVVVVGSDRTVTVPGGGQHQFYRLFKP